MNYWTRVFFRLNNSAGEGDLRTLIVISEISHKDLSKTLLNFCKNYDLYSFADDRVEVVSRVPLSAIKEIDFNKYKEFI